MRKEESEEWYYSGRGSHFKTTLFEISDKIPIPN